MTTNPSGMYMTNKEWFRDVLDDGCVLCHTSALECLELFSGYLEETNIDVYAKKEGAYENVNYHVVQDFDNIEIIEIGKLLCTSINQTVNDMLRSFEHIDEQSLIEALSCYYFENGESFSGLKIEPRNHEQFEKIRDWAVEYYHGG